MTSVNHSPLLKKSETKTIQSITGSLLYHARALDSTMLPALNEISSTQAKPTTYTKDEYQQILDYSATYPNI